MKLVLAHGPGGMFDLFPLFFIAAAVWVIRTALRDGQNKTTKTRSLPTSPLSRQVHAATYRRPGDKSDDKSNNPDRSAVRRFKAPKLQVMEGEGGEGNRPAVPRRFDPPPYGRRKTG
jgi:hypothetical protein